MLSCARGSVESRVLGLQYRAIPNPSVCLRASLSDRWREREDRGFRKPPPPKCESLRADSVWLHVYVVYCYLMISGIPSRIVLQVRLPAESSATDSRTSTNFKEARPSAALPTVECGYSVSPNLCWSSAIVSACS